MSQNYKETLNLPKTDFPMKASLTTREPEMLKKWEAAGLYAQIQAARADAELFVLHDGPPFANGDVHMGTALNKILKDLVVKSKTMAGFRAPLCAGLGLPRVADRIQGGERIARPFAARSAEKIGSVREKIRRYPAGAIQAARRLRRLGASLSDHGSGLRSRDSSRLCRLRREGPGLRKS